MPTFTWWIDEPLVRGSANPTDRDLHALRAGGFTMQFRCWSRASSFHVTTSNQPSPAAGPSIPFPSKKVLLPHLNRFAIS